MWMCAADSVWLGDGHEWLSVVRGEYREDGYDILQDDIVIAFLRVSPTPNAPSYALINGWI